MQILGAAKTITNGDSGRIVHIGKGHVRIVPDAPRTVPFTDIPIVPQKLNGVAAFYARKTSYEREAIRASRRKPYTPGPLLDLESDACRFTIHGQIMCGAKVHRKSCCEAHYMVSYGKACSWPR